MLSSVRGSTSALLRTCLTTNAAARCSVSAPRSSPFLAFSQSRSVSEIWKNSKRSDAISDALSREESLYKTYRPFTPGVRHLKRPLNPHLFEGKPLRALTVAKRKKGGRNSTGRITVRHIGGGHKLRIRVIDYKRMAPGTHDVVRIEYDPNRSAHIALLYNRDPNAVGTDKWSYIISTDGLRAGDEVRSFREGIPAGFLPGFASSANKANSEDGSKPADKQDLDAVANAMADSAEQSLALGLLRSMILKNGNVLPLHLIPPGTVINTISLTPNGPGVLVRSAGTFGQLMIHENDGRYSQVKLQSGEVRRLLKDCCATIGKVSNPLWKNRNLGKAGRARWFGVRPSVRGVAMNANDHPHGGGRGKSKGGRHPVSIWGWGTKGTRTRKPGPKGPKNSNKMVVRERPRGKEKQSSA